MGGLVDVVVRDVLVAAGFGVADRLVLVVVVVFGVFGYDVPGVEEAGDEAEAAEGDVDQAVGGADAGFDPDCARRRLVMGVRREGGGKS